MDNVNRLLDGAARREGIICDGFRLTVPAPYDEDCRGRIARYLDELGIVHSGEGLYQRSGKGPVYFKHSHYGNLGVLWLSGAVCAEFRVWDRLDDVVAAFAGFPRRITRLDAAADYQVSAPSILRALKAAGRSGALRLTRKIIPRQNVRWVESVCPVTGEETGTLYLGQQRSAEVWAAIYDKRAQLVDAGKPDPGPLLRLEIRVRDVGAELGDVLSPERLFYHFASPDLVGRPAGVGAWVAHSEGFVGTPSPSASPQDRIERIVRGSGDFGRCLELADEIGEGGIETLLLAIRRRVRRREEGLKVAGAAEGGGKVSV